MPRRQYGTGAVYYRESRSRWEGTLEAGWTARGTRRRITVTGKTEAAAKAALKAKARELARGEAGTTRSTTVKSWAEEWLAIQVRSLRPKTYADYKSAVGRWIVPTIGSRRLDALTPGDVRVLEKAQRDAGRTSTTALRTHVVLVKMLKDAVQEGHQVSPRVIAAKRPAIGTNDRDALTLPEAVKVLEVAAGLPDGSRWVAALLQGMRQGECLGLTWEAVNTAQRTLDVSWQLQTLPYIDRRNKALGFRIPDGYEVRHLYLAWHLVRPKSNKGWRVIPLVPWMSAALDQWRQIGPNFGSNPYGLVWPRPDGLPMPVKTDEEAWRALQDTAGVRHPSGRYYLLHEARHTTVTLLLELGVDPGVVTALVGHSSITTTRGYQHVGRGPALAALEAAAERLRLTV